MDVQVLFRIGKDIIGIDVNKVREVATVSEIVIVPKSPSFVMGLVNLRGDVIPVISLKKRLGMSDSDVSNLLLVIEDKGRVVGFKIDEVLGTKKIDEARVHRRAESLAARSDKAFFLGVYEHTEPPVLVLNVERTLSREDT